MSYPLAPPDSFANDACFIQEAQKRCKCAIRNTGTGAWLASSLARLEASLVCREQLQSRLQVLQSELYELLKKQSQNPTHTPAPKVEGRERA